jgi:hypothetical protein
MKFYIPNYNIYQTDHYDEHKGGTAVAVKKGHPKHMRKSAAPPFGRSNVSAYQFEITECCSQLFINLLK